MPACLYLSISRYKNYTSQTFHTSFNVFNIKEFKLKILTAVISGATERRRKLEMLEI